MSPAFPVAPQESHARTSSSCFLLGGGKESAPVVRALEARAGAAMAAAREQGVTAMELASVEPIQIVHYTRGQFYTAHYDNRDASQLSRACTFMVHFFPRSLCPALPLASSPTGTNFSLPSPPPN